MHVFVARCGVCQLTRSSVAREQNIVIQVEYEGTNLVANGSDTFSLVRFA